MARYAAQGVERRRLQVRGVVQGVGFRPLVFRLAVEHGLGGYVCNRLGDVTIEVEGQHSQVRGFCQELLHRTAPPARIEQIEEERLPPAGYATFSITHSGATGRSAPLLPPDMAVCAACRSDIIDSLSRYSAYPFTSCIECGPRYAAIQALPYDRANTSMAPFSLCDACHSEYDNPLCRRFHAQTIACAHCGPQVELWTNGHTKIEGDWRALTQHALQMGRIAALKGLGGFHLVCDATRREVVERLRQRKRRPRKPLALMVHDVERAAQHFDLSPDEWALLQSRQAPILLARPRPSLYDILPIESLAPGYSRLGIMLPYTPLHLLLFSEQLPFLVVTSGNASGLPMPKRNGEALQQLAHIADLFVLHNREIVARVEDSVCQSIGGSISLIRRSRGYVPEAISIPLPPEAEAERPTILAVGAEQKNTFCLLQGGQAVLGPYIGNIDNAEQVTSWCDEVSHLIDLFQTEPHMIAYDPHPGYLVCQKAIQIFAGKAMVPVYHHHAHMAACMAEHGLQGPAIGCILDGTGFGSDGTLWGCEILVGDYAHFKRMNHLKPMLLPGGEEAVRQPWLVATSILHDMAQDAVQTAEWVRQLFPQHQAKLPFVLAQLNGQIIAPRASSAGRLFDAVAALTGLCSVSNYEGEAAILLGEQAEVSPELSDAEWAYPLVCESDAWQTGPLIRHLLADLRRSVPIPVIARKFHHSIAQMVCDGALRAHEMTGLRTIVLGGGVWQNRYLLSTARKLLTQQGFQLFIPQRVPAGDGGIALGQAVAALWRWYRDVSGGTGKGA